ncbi:MAG TPA: YjfB family protein [Geothrix sp.]|nr:YjfB family protein [Geothrix sp.]
MEISPVAAAAQSQANLQNQLAVSVLKKSLDMQAQQGEELVKMMAQAGGIGGRVDQYA